METILISAVIISIFWLGMATGAIIENRRLSTKQEIISHLAKTQEVLLPLGNKIEHIPCHQKTFFNGTMVDYNMQDPDKTMEIPVYEKLIEELWLDKKQRS